MTRSTHPAPLGASERRRGLIALIGSTAVALVGQFMVTPMIVFWLSARETPVALIGFIAASGWLGNLLTTPFAASIVKRMGHRRVLIASLAVPSATVVGLALSQSVWLWASLTFIGGVAMSLRWIVTEASIAEFAPAERRGRIVGLYQTLLGGTFVVAPALLAWMGPLSPSTPWVAAGLLFTGLLLTLAVPRIAPDTAHAPTGLRGLAHAFTAFPAIFVAGLLGGFFEMGIASMLPAYGLAIGLGTAAAALLISASGAGSSLAMLPLGEAADRFSRRRVMLGCAVATLVATLMLPIAATHQWLAWPICFVWGGAGGALYTLAIIDIGHRCRGNALISATSLLVSAYTLGGLLGPIVSGLALQWSARIALPLVFALIAGAGCAAIARLYHDRADHAR